jgi:hypothetical protein
LQPGNIIVFHRHRLEYNIKRDLEKNYGSVWTGFIWHRTRNQLRVLLNKPVGSIKMGDFQKLCSRPTNAYR